jgi:hypothetical protein
MRFNSTVSTCRKSTARIPAAWACRNCRHVGPDRRGAGSMPAARRISHPVDGATAMPSFVSSPWIRRCPHSGFSLASRTTRRAMPGAVGGRPGLRRLLVPYPAYVPAQHRVLMPEHEQLGISRPVTAERQDGQAEHPARQQVDDLEQHPASQLLRRPSCRQKCR